MNTLHVTWTDDGKGRVRAVKALRAASKYLTTELSLQRAQAVLEEAIREGYALVGETGSAMQMSRAVHEIEEHSDGTLTPFANADPETLATASAPVVEDSPEVTPERLPSLEGVKLAILLQDPSGEHLHDTVARVVNLHRVTGDDSYQECMLALALAFPFLESVFRQAGVWPL